MPKRIASFLLIMLSLLCSCNMNARHESHTESFTKGTYGYDLEFLKKYDSVIVLKGGTDHAQVIVSPRYQAKVFTSTADGLHGRSFGWVNYKAFAAASDPHMNAYGGENRIWLGPEGGPYSLFFRSGDPMNFDNWKTPPAFDSEPWLVVSRNDKQVQMQKDMELTNYAGTRMKISADRTVAALDKQEINALLDIALDDSVRSVGYSTINTITNTGNTPWTEKSGMPCIWILDMLNPSPATVIVIPYRNPTGKQAGKIATTDYFGEISADRLKYKAGNVLFKADGKRRGKLGLGPSTAKPYAGSYDIENKILTITHFDVDTAGKYLNQAWNPKVLPFSGDAVNAYNDGPLENGSQMGPFYELESVSPAAFLKPGDRLSHKHTVIHLTGNEQSLNQVCRQVLGISIDDIRTAF